MACHETIQDKCADACTSPTIDQPCGGTVLRCLTEKLEEIADAECKKEVFYFVKMEARAPPRPTRCMAACLPLLGALACQHLTRSEGLGTDACGILEPTFSLFYMQWGVRAAHCNSGMVPCGGR